MSVKNARIGAVALGFTLGALEAQAGVYIGGVVRDTASGAERPGVDMYFEGGKARIEDLRGERPGVTIFRDDTLYMLDPKKKTYMAMTKADIDQLAGQMGGAMAEMQAQLASLPPEQRAMVEQVMKGKGGGMPGEGESKPPVITATDSGKSESVNGKSCRTWNIKSDDVLIRQLCVVPYASVPGTAEMREVVQRLSVMTEKLTEAAKQFGVNAGDALSGMAHVDGMPILMRSFTDGEPDGTESIVKEWATRANPSSLFEVPSDYKQRKAGP
ncbi:MAG TPA: hypothetical protein VE046_10010 [Steroidobacteraceae bacterium]|nr:hypothetical protein [Steroidobacteraceae bacterium]